MSSQFKLSRFGRGAIALQSTTDEALSLDTIRQHVPAVFADTPHDSRSTRFVPVPTALLLEAFHREGFGPFAIGLAGTGDDTKRAHTKHMIRLRHANTPAVRPEWGRIVPELVLQNANDGTGAYTLTLGLYRFVCLNGLMVGTDYDSVHVRHSGRAQTVIDNVIEGSFRVVKDAPALIDNAARFHAVTMPDDARVAFAQDAVALRWGTDPAPVPAVQLLAARRTADDGKDIWSTFNVLQEALMRGGQRYQHVNANGLARPAQRRKVRAVQSLSDTARINRALWDEASAWHRALVNA